MSPAPKKGSAAEKPKIQTEKIPLSPRGARLKAELLSKIVPWQEITVSPDKFPYYIDEHSKPLLMECVASHLKPHEFRKYGGRLKSSSDRILLQSLPGTELYREKLVSALAWEMKVPLLKVDLDHEYDEKEDDSDDKASPFTKGDRVKFNGKAIPIEIEGVNNRTLSNGQRGEVCEVNGEGRVAVAFNICGLDETKEAEKDEKNTETFQQALVAWLDGNDVKQDLDAQTHDCYIALEVLYQVLESQKPVIVYFPDSFLWPSMSGNTNKPFFGKVKKNFNQLPEGVVMICAQNKQGAAEVMKKYNEARAKYSSLQVPPKYELPDKLFTNVVCIKPPKEEDQLNAFVKQIEEDKLTVISKDNLNTMNKVLKYHNLSCMNLEISDVKDMTLTREKVKKIVGWATNHYLSTCPFHIPHESMKLAISRLKKEENETIISNKQPKNIQVEEDKLAMVSKGNLSTMHEVLNDHNLSCMNLELSDVEDMILTREKAEKILGWAKPCVEEKLDIPRESIKLAISRLMEEESHTFTSNKQTKSIQDLATGPNEKSLVSAVVLAEDIGVKFDDVGALQNVKEVLHETVILPMTSPELFSHGILSRYSCNGILLFGPPGTGKTLIAKALATESGANFINVTAATITSKWLGETENLTRALFSYASKLAPVIIFVDEVDSLLGARDSNKYHHTNRLNEFMAAWDGLKSKDSQRILVVGATNRPYDLDEAVIRRMPRRIFVDLPDVDTRFKILEVLLHDENLESGFSFKQLAEATKGYSGSDLKNLCVTAATRLANELDKQKRKGEASDGVGARRPLNLNDFIHSKAKVKSSVAQNSDSINKLKEWNKLYGEGEAVDE